jgi:hypothetical protein
VPDGKPRTRNPKTNRTKYDWNQWRKLYIRGDDNTTLESLSLLENAPSLGQLKRRSSQENWAEDRAWVRDQSATKARESDAFAITEIRQRHAEFSRALQNVIARALANPEELIHELRRNPSALASLARAAMEIERRAYGLEELNINLNNLTDEQLARIAAGEDPAKVVGRA